MQCSWCLLLGVLLLSALPLPSAAQISPSPEQQGQELQQVVESTFGPKYNLGYFVDVDHALKTESERFFDPQGTLHGTVLFSAIKGNMIAVGVYRDGNVLWTDQWEAVCISGTGFNGTRELNQDGPSNWYMPEPAVEVR